jgi:molybdopterin-guanine dinucleotide biosynthesis protein A
LERINNQRLIERTIERISSTAQPVLVVTSQEQFEAITAYRIKAKVVVDIFPGRGALGGIYTGLAFTDSFYSLVVGCDMPFLSSDLLRYLIGSAAGFDAVVPRLDGMMEPLHAVYSKNCQKPIREMIDEDRLEIFKLFDTVRTRYIGRDELEKLDPRHLSFFNINTINDLKKAKKLIEVEG